MALQSERSVAVVPGASSGLGLELAKVFAERGYDLILTAEHAAGLDEAARACERVGARVLDRVPAELVTFDGIEDLYAGSRRPAARSTPWR